MKKYRTPLFAATVFCVASSSSLQAGNLKVINGLADQRIQLCIRGESLDELKRKDCFGPTIEAGSERTYSVEEKNVGGSPTFEVTASTGEGGDPNWKLFGGTCSNLVTKADHTLLIQSTLGKLSCKNITAGNPMPQ